MSPILDTVFTESLQHDEGHGERTATIEEFFAGGTFGGGNACVLGENPAAVFENDDTVFENKTTVGSLTERFGVNGPIVFENNSTVSENGAAVFGNISVVFENHATDFEDISAVFENAAAGLAFSHADLHLFGVLLHFTI